MLFGARLIRGLLIASALASGAHATEKRLYSYDALGRVQIVDVRVPNQGGYAAGYGLDAASNRLRYTSAVIVRTGTLPPNATISIGQGIVSSNGSFRFTLQFDGNLVLYSGPTEPLWATMSFNATNAHLDMLADGNLCLFEANQVAWCTYTNGHPGAYLSIRDDGNMVVCDTNGQVIWSRS